LATQGDATQLEYFLCESLYPGWVKKVGIGVGWYYCIKI
jgi:hypothetical protein